MTCPSCGKNINRGEQYCKHCGFKPAVIYAENDAEDASKAYFADQKGQKSAGGLHWNSFTQVKAVVPGARYYQPLIFVGQRRGKRGKA